MQVPIHPSAGAQQASLLTHQQSLERPTGLGFGCGVGYWPDRPSGGGRPSAPNCIGLSLGGVFNNNILKILHLHRLHWLARGFLLRNTLTIRDLHRTIPYGPSMVLRWSSDVPPIIHRCSSVMPLERFQGWGVPFGLIRGAGRLVSDFLISTGTTRRFQENDLAHFAA